MSNPIERRERAAWDYAKSKYGDPAQPVSEASFLAGCDWQHKATLDSAVEALLACDVALCNIIEGNYADDQARAARTLIAKTLGVPEQAVPIRKHDLEAPKT